MKPHRKCFCVVYTPMLIVAAFHFGPPSHGLLQATAVEVRRHDENSRVGAVGHAYCCSRRCVLPHVGVHEPNRWRCALLVFSLCSLSFLDHVCISAPAYVSVSAHLYIRTLVSVISYLYQCTRLRVVRASVSAHQGKITDMIYSPEKDFLVRHTIRLVSCAGIDHMLCGCLYICLSETLY